MQVGSQRRDISARTETGSQQPACVQPLQPLGVVDVVLSARDGACFADIGQNDLETVRFEDLEGGYPVDAGRFHHHRRGTGCDEPVGHALQIAGECLERLYRLIAQIRADSGNMESRADIDTGGKRMNNRKPGGLR